MKLGDHAKDKTDYRYDYGNDSLTFFCRHPKFTLETSIVSLSRCGSQNKHISNSPAARPWQVWHRPSAKGGAWLEQHSTGENKILLLLDNTELLENWDLCDVWSQGSPCIGKRALGHSYCSKVESIFCKLTATPLHLSTEWHWRPQSCLLGTHCLAFQLFVPYVAAFHWTSKNHWRCLRGPWWKQVSHSQYHLVPFIPQFSFDYLCLLTSGLGLLTKSFLLHYVHFCVEHSLVSSGHHTKHLNMHKSIIITTVFFQHF